jgi:hypothetical protein
MTKTHDQFYIIGGTMGGDSPSYVKRAADDQLYDGLLAGNFCYVLTSHQMGKSSLMVRVAERLRAADVVVVSFELVRVGTAETA